MGIGWYFSFIATHNKKPSGQTCYFMVYKPELKQ